MGRGPARLLAGGLAERLGRAGHDISVDEGTVDVPDPPVEPGSTFSVLRELAPQVRSAVESGSLPLVLAGQCMSSLATSAGLGGQDLGVVWFDAHGDVNTPETSPSGFLDGMAISSLVGRCWKELSATIDGFKPLAAELDGPLRHIADTLIADQDCVCVQARGLGRAKNGRRYDNDYCYVFRLADGRITHVYEYLDTELVTFAFG